MGGDYTRVCREIIGDCTTKPVCYFFPTLNTLLSFILFIYLIWLHWVFVAVCGLLIAVASLVVEHGL